MAVIVILVVVVLVVAAGLALRRQHSETLSFDGPVRALEVHVASGAIRVTGCDEPGALVTRDIRWLFVRPRLDERVDGATLRLEAKGSPLLSGIVEYSVRLPAGASVTVRNVAGEIDLRDLTGDVEARTGAGSVSVDNASGRLSLRASAGSLTGLRLASPALVAETSGGSVRLEFAQAPDSVEVTTRAGSAEVRLPGGPYAVDAQTDAGSANVEVPTDAGSSRRVKVTTKAGSITVRPA